MKELYFIILTRRKSSFHANFRSTVHRVYIPVLTYAWSGLISIIFSRSKGVTYAYALDRMEILLTYKISSSLGAMVSEIRVFKRRR